MKTTQPVIFAGTPVLAANALRKLIGTGVNVVAVLTREDAPFGRKRVLTPSPVAQLAEEHQIPVIKANEIGVETDRLIQQTGARLGVIVAYGALLKQHSLDILDFGWINLHYSLLPKYRGAAPVQRAMINAEEFTGVSIFKLTAGLDTGPLISQEKVKIPTGINAGTFLDELTQIGARMLPATIESIFTGTASYIEQQGSASHAAKLTKDDACVDFAQSTSRVIGLINGTSPAPGAWSYFQNKTIKFSEAAPTENSDHLLEGHFEAVEDGIMVGTKDGAVKITRLQPAGKKMMNAVDWCRGITGEKVFSSTREEY